MRVLLKLRLECRAEAAWRALQSPTVMRETAGPLIDYASLERGGFPPRWEDGDHELTLLGAGRVPLGTQRIRLDIDTTTFPDVALGRDSGMGIDGLPSVIRSWDHRMAVSEHPGDRAATLYRDRLVFDAGPATLAMWPALWSLWQWRGHRLRQLAPGFDDLRENPAV